SKGRLCFTPRMHRTGFQRRFFCALGLLFCFVVPKAAPKPPGAPPNCSNKEQQVTFSHTYRIDVPKATQVQVEADPPPLGDQGTALIDPGEAGEEQNIIFRHNIRLQAPKADCEAAGGLQDLLARVKKLEDEVAELKEKCNPQNCCGGAQGLSGHCSGHGTFIPQTCSCQCDVGWRGPDCSLPGCPGACSGHGRCMDGQCVCDEPYIGEDCGYLPCPENCSGNGVCVRGVCQCHEDFISEDCSERRCPNDCSGHGFCDAGECYCEEGFTGLDCSEVVAPQRLQLLKSTEDSLLVNWDRVTDVDHYLLSYYPMGLEHSVKQVQVPKDQLSYEILGLLPSTEYIVTLRNVKKGLSSTPQHLLATTDLALIGTAWVTDETETSLEVEWENPPMEVDYYKLKFSPLLGQEVEEEEEEEKEVTVLKSNDPKSRYDLTGLQPGTEYKITVIPMRGGLEGKSMSLNGRTGIDSPTNLVTDRVTEDTAVVSWDVVQAPIDRYVVRYASADGETKDVPVAKDQSTTTLTDLRPGAEYSVYVWAEKGTQESKKANTKAETDIDSPANVVTERVTEDTAIISWDKVQAPIDRYMLRYIAASGETKDVPVVKDQSTTTLTGLRPGVEYSIYVWAEKGTHESKKSDTKAETEIDGPKNLVTDRVTENTVIVSWDRVQAPIDRYVVRYTSADGESKDVPVAKDQVSTTLTGLRPGEEYSVSVWAEKGTQESKKADTKAKTEIDGPKNLVTDQVTENTVIVSWDRVQAPIDRYVVRYTSADGESKDVPVAKDQVSTTLTGLRPGEEYSVSMWAEKGTQESKKADTKAETEINGPKSLVTDRVTENTAIVSWDRVQAPIDRYVVRYTSADGESKDVPVAKDQVSTTLTGLRPGEEYSVSVWAEKGTQESKKADTKAETGIDGPKNLVTDRVTENTAIVSWDKVQAPIDRYVIRYISDDGETKDVPVAKDQSTITLTGLNPGVEYSIYLWAEKGTQESRKADTKAETEIDGPKNLVTDRVTEDTAIVSWDRVQAPIDRYIVRYTSADGETTEVPVAKDQSTTTLTGLRPGAEYSIYVWAEKGTQESKKANTKAETEIDSPKNLVTDRVTEDAAVVSWDRVEAPIDRYIVRYTSADGETKEVPVMKDQTTTTLTGLRPGVEYSVYVWAEKGTQESKKADTKTETEIDSPKNVVTDRVTENTAIVSWDRVQAPIDRYIVRYTSADGETNEVPVAKDQSTITLTGLRPGMEYSVYVWAEKGTKESKKADTKAETEIDSPTNLVTNRVTEDSAVISWDGVQAPIDRYLVRYTSADGETKVIPVGKDKKTTTLTGLRPGMEYSVYVWAEKGSRESKTADTKALTDIDPPKNLRVSDVTQSGGVVTWKPPSAQIDGYILTYQAPDGTSKEVQLGSLDQRFTLESLEHGASYTISLVAFKGARQSRRVFTTLSTVGVKFPHPSDCSQVQQNGNVASGMYTIYLHGDASRPLEVYCDMDTDGGGWIVFQRRNTGQLDFFKRWRTYVEGFGDPTGEFWLGLEKLHNLTSGTPIRYEVRVDLKTSNESAYAVYDFFQVASSKDRYKLSVGKYRGTAGDALTYHNGWKFTTFDRDNDIALSNCALTHHGGWWYKNCHLANPNGKYGETKHSEGVNWEPWKGHEFSIPNVELKIRPQNFSSEHVLGRKKRTLAGKRKITRRRN
ncbi:tenascin-N, partial [Tachyglossus aculeatus]|uniref:tenascin-N n=1 Tax=Tachyglossus aculeatus TaxID=9261 RepID=UPI0018F7C76E